MVEGTGLFELVQARLDEAAGLLARLEVSAELRSAVDERIARLRGAARHDLSVTSRRVEQLVDDLEAGHPVPYDD